MANKYFNLRTLLQSAGAVLGVGIVTPLLSGFGGFLTASVPGFAGLSLAGVAGAYAGVLLLTMLADRMKW